MTYGEQLKVPILINTKMWFSLTNELTGQECDLFFTEILNNYLGKEQSDSLPPNLLYIINRSNGLLLKNAEQSQESHWNWKGGVTKENASVRASSKYKNWRRKVFSRDRFICQTCNKNGRVLNAHHIVPFSIDKSLRFELSNGLTLCKQCHIELHKTERLWH